MEPDFNELLKEAQVYIPKLNIKITLEKIVFYYDKEEIATFEGPHMVYSAFAYTYGITHAATILIHGT